MAVLPLYGIGLCSGVAGLDLALKLALGERYRTVAHVEREAFAAATLVARMADEALDQAPVWDDLTTFDGRAWRGVVDIVTAGFPCQPFSSAGLRLGTEDDRWLWPEVARVVREVGCDYVFLENVPDLLLERGGIREVLGELSSLGFDAEWEVFSARSVGAPHERKRFYCLAWRELADTGGPRRPEISRCSPGDEGPNGRRSEGYHLPNGRGQGVAHSDRDGRSIERCKLVPQLGQSSCRDHADGRSGATVEHTEDVRPSGRDARRPEPGDAWASGASRQLADTDGIAELQPDDEGRPKPRSRSRSRASRSGGRLPLFPPSRDDIAGWMEVLDRSPGLEPSLRRVADGTSGRVDRRPAGWEERTHAIGNGVVPLVAAVAFRRLARRAGREELLT